MVNARLCETARQASFSASPRHLNFLDYKTKTSMCFEYECMTFRLLKFEPQIWLRAMRMSQNEHVQKSYKGVFCQKYLNVLYTVPQGEANKFSHFVGFLMNLIVGCVWLLDSPFSLLASFCEQAETGNSTLTHYVMIF